MPHFYLFRRLLVIVLTRKKNILKSTCRVALLLNVFQLFSILYLPINSKAVFSLSSKFIGSVWSIIQRIFEAKHRALITFSGNVASIPQVDSSHPDPESAIVLSNHVCAIDWILLNAVAKRKGVLDHLKYFVKDSLKYLPVFGWGMYLGGFLFLRRNWMQDEKAIQETFYRIKQNKSPIWLISFIEGHRVTPKKLVESQSFCKSRNRPVLLHTLYPRTKGAVATIQNLRKSHVNHLYDFTIAFKNVPSNTVNGTVPSIVRVLSHDLNPDWKFHVHVDRYLLDDLPSDDEKLSKWIEELWVKKDKRLGEWKSSWPEDGSNGVTLAAPYWRRALKTE